MKYQAAILSGYTYLVVIWNSIQAVKESRDFLFRCANVWIVGWYKKCIPKFAKINSRENIKETTIELLESDFQLHEKYFAYAIILAIKPTYDQQFLDYFIERFEPRWQQCVNNLFWVWKPVWLRNRLRFLFTPGWGNLGKTNELMIWG